MGRFYTCLNMFTHELFCESNFKCKQILNTVLPGDASNNNNVPSPRIIYPFQHPARQAASFP